jgi:hypothetical protein
MDTDFADGQRDGGLAFVRIALAENKKTRFPDGSGPG